MSVAFLADSRRQTDPSSEGRNRSNFSVDNRHLERLITDAKANTANDEINVRRGKNSP